MIIFIVLILTGIYLLFALPFSGNLLLSFDEAHYALYGYYPDISYFDHPPLVGWIQWIMQQVFSGDEFYMRLPALLSSSGVLIAMWFAMDDKKLYPILRNSSQGSIKYNDKLRFGRWFIAFILFLSCPIFFGLGFAFLPDSLILLFTFPIIIQTLQAAHKDRWIDYLLLGILLGIAGLSKYSAILLALSSAWYIWSHRGWRIVLNPRPWLSFFTALIIFSPVLVWNWQNKGKSFAYQLEHAFGRNWFDWSNLLISHISQIVAYMPAVYIFSLVAALWVLRKKRQEFYVNLIFALPPFIILAFSPAFGKFLPHWIAFMFLILLPVAATMIYELWTNIKNLNKVQKIKVAVFKITFIICLLLSFTATAGFRFIASGIEFRMPPYFHPWLHVIGWDKISHQIVEDALENPEYNIIFTNSWFYAAPLAWYARPMPVIPVDDRIDQFDFWFGSPQRGQSGYLVIPHYETEYNNSIFKFAECNHWKNNNYFIKGSPVLSLDIYKCNNFSPRNN